MRTAKNGFKVTMIYDDLTISQNEHVLLTGNAIDDTHYKMNFGVITKYNAHVAVCNDESLDVWHRRLGHANYNTISEMIRNGRANGFNCSTFKRSIECVPCIKGKMTRSSFKNSSSRAAHPGELFHFDIMGPYEVRSLSHSSYLCVFVDDMSGMLFTYPVRNKSDITQVLLKLIAEVNVDGIDIKRMRSDNALEFRSKEMSDIMANNRIHHEFSAPYCPEQNGRAERQNRTIQETINTIRADANLPAALWAELANTAAYLRNRTSIERLGWKTPYECYFGIKPNVSHLRRIGSKAYAHIPDQHRRKLDNRCEELILIGYQDKTRNYRLWNKRTNLIRVTPNVKIIENELNGFPPIELSIENSDESDEPQISNSESVASRTRSKSNSNEITMITELFECESDPDLRKLALINEILNVPNTIDEAVNGPESGKWISAMEDEMNSLINNKTWKLVNSETVRKKPLKTKWIFKHKFDENGNVVRYKARLVVKGCSQKDGIDFTETFSPVARYDTVRSVIAIAAQKSLKLNQFDIKTAFLNGEINEEIYIEQPQGFKDGSGRLCRLKKSLYGLKQAPRAWNETLDRALKSFGLSQSKNDPCLYSDDNVLLVIYVDDGLIASRSGGDADRLIRNLGQLFEIKSEEAKFYLGLQIERNNHDSSIKIHQSIYTQNLIKRFNMENCNKASIPMDPDVPLKQNNGRPADVPYRQIIGGLMYLSIMTRPDITFAVNKLSQFLANPSKDHWRAAKHVLAYLKGTTELGIRYHQFDKPHEIELYTDADFAMCLDTRKSTSGVVITLNNSPIGWFSRKQNLVTNSTTYAEYIAAHDGACDAVWMRRLFGDMNCQQLRKTPLFCDNEAAIDIVKSTHFHQRTKHIDIKFHFVKDLYQRNLIDIKSISTDQQKADLLTKPLKIVKLERSLKMLNLC